MLCTVSAEEDDNRSQFFITLGDAAHLNGVNTIFGKVPNDTIFTGVSSARRCIDRAPTICLCEVVKMEDLEVDDDDRPHFPPKIISVEVCPHTWVYASVQPHV